MESKIHSKIVITSILAFAILGVAGMSTGFVNVFAQGEGGGTEGMPSGEGMTGEGGNTTDSAMTNGGTGTTDGTTIGTP
jgi:hypothetical protein